MHAALEKGFSHEIGDIKPAGNLAVLPGMAFVADFRMETQRAQKRTWGGSMLVKYGSVTGELVEGFLKKDETDNRDRTLHADYKTLIFTQLERLHQTHKTPPFSWHKEGFPADRMRNAAMFNRIESDGGKVIFINRPKKPLEHLISTAGRNHSKMAVVDDVAYIGGVNFMDENITIDDCMVKVTTPELVGDIADQFHRVNENARTKDYAYPWRDGTRILVDAGHDKTSLIVDTAVELMERAQQTIRVVSPVKPDGIFLDALNRAYKRGVDVQMVVPTPSGFGLGFWLANRISEASTAVRGNGIPLLQYENDLHAKALLVDNQEGLVGSNNFTWKGVWMETGETAIQSQDSVFVNNLQEFFKPIWARSRPISHHIHMLGKTPYPESAFDKK